MAYFDHNATTQPMSDALEAIHLASKENWQNPSSPHRSGSRVRAGIEKAREEIINDRRKLFNLDDQEKNKSDLKFF